MSRGGPFDSVFRRGVAVGVFSAAAAVLVVVAAAALLLPAATAWAHDLRPGVVAFEQVEGDEAGQGTQGMQGTQGTQGIQGTQSTRWRMRVVPPLDGAPLPVILRPALPPGCQVSGRGQVFDVACEGPLQGPLGLRGVAGRRVKVLVSVDPLGDAASWQQLLREGQATAVLPGGASGGAAEDEASVSAAAAPYGGLFGRGFFALGVEHILGGIDHLLFVLALALLARSLRRVAVAVTGFTVAHSITLAAASLGLVEPPSAATELVIALSVLFLAAEAARSLRRETAEPTLAARQPVLVALLFGLVHGFGFAGALGELGLPADALLSSLLAFNLGVEVGQLGVLVVAVGLAFGVGRFLPDPVLGARLVAGAIGVVSAAWCWERGGGWVASLGGG